MIKVLLSSIVLLSAFSSHAQETLATDQNPNYKASLKKYNESMSTLQSTMNTTVQNTYKAYDWYEAKQERKEVRRNDRRERNLYMLQNYGNYFNPYNNFYDPYVSTYRYSPYRYRYNWRRR